MKTIAILALLFGLGCYEHPKVTAWHHEESVAPTTPIILEILTPKCDPVDDGEETWFYSSDPEAVAKMLAYRTGYDATCQHEMLLGGEKALRCRRYLCEVPGSLAQR